MIDTKAQDIVNDLHSNQKIEQIYAFDPLTILAIVSLLIQIITFLYGCYKSHHKVAEVIRNPGVVNSWLFRRMVRKALRFKGYDKEVVASMLAVGKTIQDEEVVQMYEEVLKKA